MDRQPTLHTIRICHETFEAFAGSYGAYHADIGNLAVERREEAYAYLLSAHRHIEMSMASLDIAELMLEDEVNGVQIIEHELQDCMREAGFFFAQFHVYFANFRQVALV